MSSRAATWWYAVVPADAAVPAGQVSGLTGEPVRLVAHPPVAAVVGPVDLPADGSLPQRLRDPEWLEQAARRHHAVVSAYAASCPTAPLRLATVHRDDERVRQALRRHRTTLAATLATVAGRAEWGVQVYRAAPERTARNGAGEPTPAAVAVPAADQARPGTAYLQRRRADHAAREAARRQVAVAVAQVHERLAGLAVASVRHTGAVGGQAAGRTPPVLNASYLLDHDRAGTLVQAVRDLQQAHPSLRLRVTGPWPAYSFVEIDAGTAACRPE